MKTYMLPLAIVTLAVSAAAGAQTSPTSPTTPGDTSSSSSSSTQAPSSTGSSSYSNGMSDSKMMKDCVAKQKASNSQLSDADAKRACKSDSSTK